MSKQEQLPSAVVDDWPLHMDELLNEALEQTFPCSDPIAISITKVPPLRPGPTSMNREVGESTAPKVAQSETDHE